MKKVLLASTALTVMSTAAFAQGVELSGSAEMGIADDGVNDVQFFQSVDVRISMTGETDAGLSFGATIDLDDAIDMGLNGHDSVDATNGDTPDFNVFVSGSFGTLTRGDTDGAFDWALTEVAALTSIADDHTIHGGYSGNSGLDGTYDGQVLRYDNSFGDFGFALSMEMDDTGTGDDVIGVGVKWSGDMGGSSIGVGLGYQDNGLTDLTGLSLSAGIGEISAVLNYTDNSTGADHSAIGLTYETGAIGLHVNYGEVDGGAQGFGLAVNYDLGGGAILALGYGDTSGSAVAADNISTWSAGLSLSF